jgi:hypothetical protein
MRGMLLSMSIRSSLIWDVRCFFSCEEITLNYLHFIIEKWLAQGINLLQPNEESLIVTALNSTGRKHSRDVIDLYCAIGGMQEGESDSHMWSMWSLDKIVSENSRYDRPYILFADYLIQSHLYCFKYESDERSSVCIDHFNGEAPKQVASSVRDFFELYMESPGEVEIFD